VDTTGSLTLQNLTLQGGSIPSSETLGGGAVLNTGTFNATGVTFRANSAAAKIGGGAIDNHDLAILNVATSTFVGNSGLQGGAIENEGTYCDTSRSVCASATVTDSAFQGNSTTSFGGGAIETQLAEASPVPSCPPKSPGQCEMPAGAVTTVVRSTFTGNSAATEGGAIANFGNTTVNDSTITGNTTKAANDNFGGGGLQNTGNLVLTSTTLAGNTSAYGANLHTYHDTADGLPNPVTTLSSTLVAALGAPGASCGGLVPVTDGGYNLDSGTSCGFSTAQHSLVNVDPKLGGLADHGGPTQTMALDPTSPAVDAIPPAANGCQGSTDQRGTARPSGAGCDIGAFELTPADLAHPTPPPPTPQPDIALPSAHFVAVGNARGVHFGKGVRRVHTPVGTGLLSTGRGATITITFKGRHLDLLFQAGRAGGKARITIGKKSWVVDLYAPKVKSLRITLPARSGTNIARIVTLGIHRFGSHGNRVLLMAMRVRAV
jgi:hypothetical protein